MPLSQQNSTRNMRNLFAFWILGMCNNFAYVIMLSAAKDILSAEHGLTPTKGTTDDVCQDKVKRRDECAPMSTGSVLLADILPSLIAKLIAPFLLFRVPFGIRHLIVVLLQSASFIVVANSNDVTTALAGVVMASAGAGLGEVTYLSLASYFSSRVITMWSSGTGGAGVLGSFAYACLTDSHMLAMKPRTALLCMLSIPVFFAFTYWRILELPPTVHRVTLFRPSSYIVRDRTRIRVRRESSSSEEEADDTAQLIDERCEDESHNFTFRQKLMIAKPLLKFMVPLSVVYFAEYFINQGLVELLVFDCDHGFALSKSSQYRWYQVLYQIGVFISRSSIDCFVVPIGLLPVLPLLQLMNATFFFMETIHNYISHIWLVFVLVFYEGLLGGCAYVNTFSAIHRTVEADKKEFSMGFASMSDSFGIVLAGFLAIPARNYICDRL